MKVTKDWLQKYIVETLPSTEKVVEAFIMHAFEVEGVEQHGKEEVLDLKVLPDRAHYALSHYGIAAELATILGLTLKPYSLKELPGASKEFVVEVKDSKLCRRCTNAVIKNVKVGPSPAWLKEKLEAIGQRSINNIVDATNFVMFSVGQPTHVFDVAKFSHKDGTYGFKIETLSTDSEITALDGKVYNLKKGTLVHTDLFSGKLLDIAGVKGGMEAALDDSTTDIVLESANFDPVMVRKTGRSLGLLTDAQRRFENEITPAYAIVGLADLISLIIEVAGGQVEGYVDVYPKPVKPFKLGVSLHEVNSILGTKLAAKEVEAILERFGFEHGCVTPHTNVVELAQKAVGKPYQWGASVLYDAPEQFDCSSLTAYLFKESGVQIPRVVADQYMWGIAIEEKALEPGDLIFSKTKRRENKIHTETVDFIKGTPVPDEVSHVGIFVDNNEVIHAADGKGVVKEKISESDSFKTIVGYRRMAKVGEKRWWIVLPPNRLDLRIKEDLVEEIGRIYGYDHIKAKEPKSSSDVPVNKYYSYSKKIRQILTTAGFSEIYTYTFTDNGEIEVANPLASDKNFLRSSLTPAMVKSLDLNKKNIDLLGLEEIKIFEIGRVFKKDREYNSLCMGIAGGKKVNEQVRAVRETLLEKIAANVQTLCTIDDTGGILVSKGKPIGEINKEDGVMELNLDALIDVLPTLESNEKIILPQPSSSTKFAPISVYPFIVRDVAVFVPGEKGKEEEIFKIIKKEATELLVNHRLFDVFTKNKPGEETKTSYAFRLVFQSHERTLTDNEINTIMESVTKVLNSHEGWQVR